MLKFEFNNKDCIACFNKNTIIFKKKKSTPFLPKKKNMGFGSSKVR